MEEILCDSCENAFDKTELIQLQTCDHNFCLICLQKYLTENIRSNIKCPVVNCQKEISGKIIRNILNAEQSEIYQKMLLNKISNFHRCILPECSREFRESNFQYECSYCSLFNCIKCNEAHRFLSCDEFNLSRNTTGRESCEKELERAKQIFNKKVSDERRTAIAIAVRNGAVQNPDVFNCPICNSIILKGDGIILRDCFHNICKSCLKSHVIANFNIPTPCPVESCDWKLHDTESKAFLDPEQIKLYEKRSIIFASYKFVKAGYCQNSDCPNIVEIIGKLHQWTCALCKSVNCYKCDVVHGTETCKEYRALHSKEIKNIKKMIKKKTIMQCPVCRKLLQRIGGCNLVKCDRCGTELCWIRQMARWGPKGRGDQTGGCKCGLDGKRCHPNCTTGCIPDGSVTYFPRSPTYC